MDWHLGLLTPTIHPPKRTADRKFPARRSLGPLGVDGERLDKFYEQGKRVYGRCDRGCSALQFEGMPMSMKHRRGNREVKKPKQNKPKVIVSTSPFASASSNLAKGAAAKRK